MDTQYSKTLYKLDTKGKERFITYEAINGELHQASGIIGSDKVVRNIRICKPKNIGKSNETTATEQAVLEAKSKIKDKLAKEYFETLEKARNTIVILPMLAKTYDKKYIEDATKIYIQPKLDGYRCIAHVKDGKVKLMSRSNKDIMITKNNSMQHIIDQMSNFPDGVYDGELYNKELGSFQEQTKAINKYRPGISEKINYNIYDMISQERFYDRIIKLDKIITNYASGNIIKTPTRLLRPLDFIGKGNISLQSFIKGMHDKYASEGYEGVIVRVDECTYAMNKRSSQLLKMKDFFDIDAKVLDVIPQDSDPTKGQPVCKSLEAIHGIILGVEFKAGMAVSHEEQINMLNNKSDYIGKTCNIRFFESTNEGKPRHPSYHGLKE